jgi:glutaredoxin
MIKSLLMILLLFSGSNMARAEIYKWVDESGRVHFGDAPDNTKSAKKVEVKVNSYEHVTNDDGVSDSDFDSNHVIMYATSWCGYCRKARNYFKANNIAFSEYDIEKDERAKKKYDALGGRGVPVILVGNKRMNGFNAQGFKRMYEAAVR